MKNMMYRDIIALSRPISVRHKPMSVQSRAAQFAPFAALAGYDAAVSETARLTDEEIERDECAKAELDSRLRILADQIDIMPQVKITYFKPDSRKKGGSYEIVCGRIKEIDDYERRVVLTDHTKIPFEHLYSMESELFGDLEGRFSER